MAPHDDEAGGQEWRPGEREGGHVTGPGQLQRSQSVVHDERTAQSTFDGLAETGSDAGQCNPGPATVVDVSHDDNGVECEFEWVRGSIDHRV